MSTPCPLNSDFYVPEADDTEKVARRPNKTMHSQGSRGSGGFLSTQLLSMIFRVKTLLFKVIAMGRCTAALQSTPQAWKYAHWHHFKRKIAFVPRWLSDLKKILPGCWSKASPGWLHSLRREPLNMHLPANIWRLWEGRPGPQCLEGSEWPKNIPKMLCMYLPSIIPKWSEKGPHAQAPGTTITASAWQRHLKCAIVTTF